MIRSGKRVRFIMCALITSCFLHGMNSQSEVQKDVIKADVPSLKTLATKVVAHKIQDFFNDPNQWYYVFEKNDHPYNAIDPHLLCSIMQEIPSKERCFIYDVEGWDACCCDSVEFDSTNKRCAFWNSQGSMLERCGIHVCGLNEGKIVAHNDYISLDNVEYSPSGKKILVQRSARIFGLFDADMNLLKKNIFNSYTFRKGSFYGSDDILKVVDSRGVVHVKNIETGELLYTADPFDSSLDGSVVVLGVLKEEWIKGDLHETLQVLRNGEKIAEWNAYWHKLSPNGKYLFLCLGGYRYVIANIFNNKKRELAGLQGGKISSDVRWSSDGNYVLFSEGSLIKLLRIKPWKILLGDVRVTSAKLVLDEQYVFITLSDYDYKCLVKIDDTLRWETAYWLKSNIRLLCSPKRKNIFEIDEKGNGLLYCDTDQEAILYDIECNRGNCLRFKNVENAFWSPDGNTLLVISKDGCKIVRFFEDLTVRQYVLKQLIETKAINYKDIVDDQPLKKVFDQLFDGQLKHFKNVWDGSFNQYL